MDYGTIEIEEDGEVGKPSWSVTSETCGFLTDSTSLDDAVAYLRSRVAEGHTIDGVCLEI